MKALHILTALLVVVLTSCATPATRGRAKSEEERAVQFGITKGDVAEICRLAVEGTTMVVVDMTKDAAGVIEVHIAESINSSGGTVLYYDKPADKWMRIDDKVGTWFH